MIDYIKYAFKNIFRKKLRSALTIAGIAIGVMAVVIISMIGDVGKQQINHELSSMGLGGMILRTDNTKTSKRLNTTQLDFVKNQSEVKYAAPLITQYSTVRIRTEKTKCIVWGVDQDTANIMSIQILHGRMINQSDVSSINQVCVVDESYALQHYKRSNIVGKNLEILFNGKYETFKIVGVAKAGGSILQNLMGNVVPCFTYIPYTTMQDSSLKTGFTQIAVQTNDNLDPQQVGATLASQIAEESGIAHIVVDDLNTQMDQLNQILNIITLVLTAIAGISLLVAGLSIMTVMLVSVSERTREIGIKKSIGANQKIILMEFLTESFLITLIGSIIGTVIGLLIGIIGCLIVGISPVIQPNMISFAILFSIGTGVLFGVYPAMKAAKLKPVDALKYD